MYCRCWVVIGQWHFKCILSPSLPVPPPHYSSPSLFSLSSSLSSSSSSLYLLLPSLSPPPLPISSSPSYLLCSFLHLPPLPSFTSPPLSSLIGLQRVNKVWEVPHLRMGPFSMCSHRPHPLLASHKRTETQCKLWLLQPLPPSCHGTWIPVQYRPLQSPRFNC